MNNTTMMNKVEAIAMNFEDVKDRVRIKLRNADSLPENTVSIPFLDMAITFQIPVPEVENEVEHGEPNVVVNYALANKWEVLAQELYLIALENETQNNPAKIETMGNMLAGLMGVSFDDPVGNTLYVATNQKGTNGASVILYPNLLREFGNKIGESFYILPSSIHEVILVPESVGIDGNDFVEMVRDINRTVVAENEILSDNVYLYDLENDEIKIAD